MKLTPEIITWFGQQVIYPGQIKLVQTCVDFIEAFKASPTYGHWITFAGEPGTGKSMALRRINRWFSVAGRFKGDLTPNRKGEYTTSHTGQYLEWLEISKLYNSKNDTRISEIQDLDLLILDEILPPIDPWGSDTETLCSFLNQRRNRWTLMATNQTVEEILNTDARIKHRLTRDGSQILEISHPPFTPEDTLPESS